MVKQQLEESMKMLADVKRVADEREAWRDDKKTLEVTIAHRGGEVFERFGDSEAGGTR